MEGAGWIHPIESVGDDRDWFEDVVFGDDTIWETDEDCKTLSDDMAVFLSNAPMYYATPAAATRSAETLMVAAGSDTVFIVVFDRTELPTGDALLNTLLHEGYHWIHETLDHGGGFDAYDAEDCARIPREDPQCDGCGGGTVTTCTDEPYTYKEWDWVWTEIEAGSCVGVSPVALPGEEPGEPELHCTPAVWGYVLMEVEKEGVRTVCVTTSN